MSDAPALPCPPGGTRVIEMTSPEPRVRVTLGREEVTLRDGALVRSAVTLLKTLEVCEESLQSTESDESIRMVAESARGFARALLGPSAHAEVTDGLAYLVVLHRLRGNSSDSAPSSGEGERG